ncbi:patatin-like phospholipase family protein [Glaciimonas sp. CA11.2]|uniref:patatin-like phospholipase family protein n=1 Tax=unclassified Glaciimonas TaxID=2644401 RepID=UPI002AB4CA58|nr:MULTISPECIES: patatin-like phospholipase family protein [unclassified Glaciimonas]MDY7546828.1 patatin-like phospholipase family protein [Glaciimonas sp. CA11.2]MEB0012297.1 patatin-like phospholipase family protein [Glaciimonas sp. Cout2]MEB0080516.1 patatin-like phospholipase family protein [Glaciimonas sp. Gout2]MEB0164337.1 patatin-like phospholipase family protein [Glaciimonas sp. CA11.2]
MPDAAPDTSPTVVQKRPRIGLVLSGGGARGYAHLGVLKMLEQWHIPIDYIAATSMGAVVGGLYASGLSADALEKKLSEINLSDIAFDRNDRAKLPQSRREDNFQYPIGLSAGYGDGKLKIATGLVQGNHLLALLQNWTTQLPANIDFDRLPTPFRTVATDLGTGEEVIIRAGSLPRAIRASMAVPGLFTPFNIDGHTLVDGGLVSNLPVQLARDMGADIIIAVNIATPLQDPSNIESPTAVAQQMVTILIRQNVKAQKALLKEKDILIEPELGDLSFTDFSRGKDGINAGAQATEQARAKLVPLALSDTQWKTYLAARQPGHVITAETRIDAINITTKGPVPAEIVQRQLGVHDGDLYNSSALNQDLTRLTTNGDFKSVTQEMVVENGRNILNVNAEAKTWGPQFLLFGFGVSNSFDGRGGFNLQIGHRFPWLTPSGLEWRNDIVLGDKQVDWRSELRQPIWDTLGLYVAPYAQYNRRHVDIYPDEGANANTVPLTSYVIDSATVGVDLGIPIARLGEFRAGVNYRQLNGHPFYNIPGESGNLFLSQQIKQTTARAQVTIDQLDDALFPRKGYYLSAITNIAFGGAENHYNDAQIKALWAISSGRHTINLALEGAGVYGADNANGSIGNGGLGFTLGGFQHLSAYAPDQFTGNYLAYGRITYLNNLREFNIPGLSNPVFGSSLEIGDVWQTRDSVNKGPYKKSVSMFVGGNSLIGPLYFGFALAPQGVWNLYLQLGRVF